MKENPIQNYRFNKDLSMRKNVGEDRKDERKEGQSNEGGKQNSQTNSQVKKKYCADIQPCDP